MAEDDPLRDSVKIKNPLVEEQSIMRTTLMPGLLEVLATNEARGTEDAAIFELGSVYLKKTNAPKDKLPRELKTLGIAIKGKGWSAGWDMPGREVDFFDLKGVLEETFKTLGINSFELHPVDIRSFHPGQRGQIVINNEPAGIMGKIHPDVAEEYELSGPVYIGEINLEVVIDEATSEKRYEQIIKYPATVRDIAVVVPENIRAGDIEQAIKLEGSSLVERIKLFDVYRGQQVEKGYKSLAYSVTYRAKDRTLIDEEINEVYDKAVAKLRDQFGAEIRS